MTTEKICTSLVNFDNLGLVASAENVRSLSQKEDFSYVVTPNIDHLSRLCNACGTSLLLSVYREASLTLCDSRVINLLLKLLGKPVDVVVPGSDLTHYLFEHVLDASNKILVLGGEKEKIQMLKQRYPFLSIDHINPSMGFIHNGSEVQTLVESIQTLQPEYIFLAVGSPRQEVFAHTLKTHGIKQGVALCVGASINFITGHEKRAPGWMQHLGLEWLYRMAQDPRRLVKRYGMNALYLPKIFFRLSKKH